VFRFNDGIRERESLLPLPPPCGSVGAPQGGARCSLKRCLSTSVARVCLRQQARPHATAAALDTQEVDDRLLLRPATRDPDAALACSAGGVMAWAFGKLRLLLEWATVPLLVIAMQLPQGTVCYWLTSGVVSAAQSLALRSRAVRSALGLPMAGARSAAAHPPSNVDATIAAPHNSPAPARAMGTAVEAESGRQPAGKHGRAAAAAGVSASAVDFAAKTSDVGSLFLRVRVGGACTRVLC
jgi:hypothetical protein